MFLPALSEVCVFNYYSSTWFSMADLHCYCQQNDGDVKRMLKCAVCQRYFHLGMHKMDINNSSFFFLAEMYNFWTSVIQH